MATKARKTAAKPAAKPKRKTAAKPRTKATPKPKPKTKPPRRTRADAARENGKRGGRPKAEAFLVDFDELGPPPKHPLELARWMQRVLAIDMHRMVTGRAREKLSREIRATASAASKLIPPDIIVEAQRLIQQDAGALEAGSGPMTEDLDPEPPAAGG